MAGSPQGLWYPAGNYAFVIAAWISLDSIATYRLLIVTVVLNQVRSTCHADSPEKRNRTLSYRGLPSQEYCQATETFW